eukprot:scaffold11330_cov22-Tisochrysis_lutea.AAC.1
MQRRHHILQESRQQGAVVPQRDLAYTRHVGQSMWAYSWHAGQSMWAHTRHAGQSKACGQLAPNATR